jgi:hypothetical protein
MESQITFVGEMNGLTSAAKLPSIKSPKHRFVKRLNMGPFEGNWYWAGLFTSWARVRGLALPVFSAAA